MQEKRNLAQKLLLCAKNVALRRKCYSAKKTRFCTKKMLLCTKKRCKCAKYATLHRYFSQKRLLSAFKSYFALSKEFMKLKCIFRLVSGVAQPRIKRDPDQCFCWLVIEKKSHCASFKQWDKRPSEASDPIHHFF